MPACFQPGKSFLIKLLLPGLPLPPDPPGAATAVVVPRPPLPDPAEAGWSCVSGPGSSGMPMSWMICWKIVFSSTSPALLVLVLLLPAVVPWTVVVAGLTVSLMLLAPPSSLLALVVS
jgi:hypothetical protein